MYYYVRSFHNKLKNTPRYLAHQVNRRIDDIIGTLLIIEEDMFFDRMRKEIMKDNKDASIKQDGSDRHARGISLAISSMSTDNGVSVSSACLFTIEARTYNKNPLNLVSVHMCKHSNKL